MTPLRCQPPAAVVAEVAEALRDVPRAAYSVPHDYPTAAPAWEAAPMAERPLTVRDQLRLYVHLPYCRYRCSFCYFAVRVGAQIDAMRRYVDAVERELEWIPEGTPLSQLYVGGGTPTVLPPELLDGVLAAVFRRTVPFGNGVHVVETSPETISSAHLEVLRRHGIGRVSMGVQSLEEEVLDRVNRDQTAAGALGACELLVASGLIANIDLIYGLPGQSQDSFLSDLTILAGLGVPSLTLYSLRVTERTPVRKELGEDRFDIAGLMAWRAFVKDAAAELGYTQTRWHTFKRLDSIAAQHERLPTYDMKELSGFQLGVGMSARSNLGHAVYRNHVAHDTYIARIEAGQSPVEQIFELDLDDRITRFIAMSLGDGRALRHDDYEAAFDRTLAGDFGPLLERLQRGLLIDDDGQQMKLTERGRLVYDLVMLAFYPARARAWLTDREDRASFVTIGDAASSS